MGSHYFDKVAVFSLVVQVSPSCLVNWSILKLEECEGYLKEGKKLRFLGLSLVCVYKLSQLQNGLGEGIASKILLQWTPFSWIYTKIHVYAKYNQKHPSW